MLPTEEESRTRAQDVSCLQECKCCMSEEFEILAGLSPARQNMPTALLEPMAIGYCHLGSLERGGSAKAHDDLSLSYVVLLIKWHIARLEVSRPARVGNSTGRRRRGRRVSQLTAGGRSPGGRRHLAIRREGWNRGPVRKLVGGRGRRHGDGDGASGHSYSGKSLHSQCLTIRTVRIIRT